MATPKNVPGAAAATTPPTSPASTRLGLLIGAAVVIVAITGWFVTRDRGLALDPRPDQNVLLVTIDSLRADAPSSYGGQATTPALDGLAARGARFTFAHTHAVSTLAAHGSLLTGRLPFEHGLRDDIGFRLSPDQQTMAGRLKSAGFATGAFVGSGRLHHRFGLDAGFDVYDDRMTTPPLTIDLGVPERPADAVVRAAVEWTGQQSGRWFAWVHLAEPHTPWTTGYLDEVAAADAALASLVGSLANADRTTLVIVTSDHGEGLGEHAEETHGVFGYETTLRVPLVVARVGPGGDDASGGRTVDAPARLIDVLPTVLDAVAVEADAGLSGASLRSLLQGGTDDRPTYFEAMSPSLTRGWAPLRGVISGRQKYIDLPVPELYDLTADPDEQRNVASVQPERVAALATVMATFDAPPPAAAAGTAPEVFERLRALGYSNATARTRDRYTEADDPKRLVEYDRVMDAATLAFEEGRYQDAAAALQQVIVERPGNAEAYRMLAVVFWHGGLPNQAILTLQAAMAAGLPHAGNRVTLGQMLAMTAGAPRAIRLLEDQTYDNLDALAALGIAYSQVGRPADAERAFNRMLEVDPASGLAVQHLGILRLRQERYADAETTLRRAIALDASLSGAYTPLGVALSEQGRLDEAIEAWQQAITLDPAEHLARFNLIVALTARDREDEARLAAEEFLRTAPPAQYQTQLALVRSLLGGG